MSNPRTGLYDGSLISMFPRRLMNKAVSTSLLNAGSFAQHIENILPNTEKAGTGAKRYGVGAKGSAIGGGVEILETMEYRNSSGGINIIVYCDDGTIRKFDDTLKTYSTLKSGLTLNGNCRHTAFNEKLSIVDGVNTPMTYDGTSVVIMKEWVEDALASGETQVDTDTITINPITTRSDYTVGGKIRVTFATAGAVEATISAVSGTTTLTIDVTATVFPSPNETITKVEYETSPPAFSDIYTEHNRLWALSEGETKANDYRSLTDGMKIYYTGATNNENTWFNATTQEVGYVNILNKSRKFDELLKISSIDGNMVFFGRQSTFIYTGDDPTVSGGFVWIKTLPVGCVNGNLVQEYPLDVVFFTEYGNKSLRRAFQTNNLEVAGDFGETIDPVITRLVNLMKVDDATFRAARSFFYTRDGFYGYKIAGDYILVHAISEEISGWVYLSGYFKDATSYLSTSDGRLLLTKGGQLFSYANGTDTDSGTGYADNGTDITIIWWTPWISKRNGRWANKGFEIMMEDTASTTLTITRATDWQNDTAKTTSNIVLEDASSTWGVSLWGVGLWGSVSRRVVVRDKFFSDSFWVQIKNTSQVGGLSFLGLRPIGK